MFDMISKERAWRGLGRREPDRARHFERVVDRKVLAALCPAAQSPDDVS